MQAQSLQKQLPPWRRRWNSNVRKDQEQEWRKRCIACCRFHGFSWAELSSLLFQLAWTTSLCWQMGGAHHKADWVAEYGVDQDKPMVKELGPVFSAVPALGRLGCDSADRFQECWWGWEKEPRAKWRSWPSGKSAKWPWAAFWRQVGRKLVDKWAELSGCEEWGVLPVGVKCEEAHTEEGR